VSRSRRPWILIAGLAAACGSMVAPFEGVPPKVAPPGIGDDDFRVSVCYNKRFSTPEQVRAVAIEACGAQGEPQLIDQDVELFCPLLTPVRANFVCSPQ
jgi:hypothetical protein